MRKKGKNIGGWFILRSVGNKAVDILFVMGNDRKSLPDELVGYSDHGEFSGLPVLPEPRVSLFALGIEPAGRPSGDIEKTSGVCVSVSVSTLSSALSSIKNHMTSVAYRIRMVIDRLKE